jgi:hypothetical protein
MILHVGDIYCGKKLVAMKTSRSSLLGDFLLRQDFGAAFIQRLNDCKVNELSSNPAGVC